MRGRGNINVYGTRSSCGWARVSGQQKQSACDWALEWRHMFALLVDRERPPCSLLRRHRFRVRLRSRKDSANFSSELAGNRLAVRAFPRSGNDGLTSQLRGQATTIAMRLGRHRKAAFSVERNRRPADGQRYPTASEKLAMRNTRLPALASISLVVGGLLGLVGSSPLPPFAALPGASMARRSLSVFCCSRCITTNAATSCWRLALFPSSAVKPWWFPVSPSILALPLLPSEPAFGAGVALWAAGLALVSAAAVMPASVRITGAGASLLFAAAVARQIHGGIALTPLSRPSPFTADPFPVLTLFGWAWVHVRSARKASSPNP